MIELLYILLSSIIGSYGAMLIKRVKLKPFFSFKWLNKNLIIGLFLYGVSSIFYLLALKLGSVSYIYPLSSLSYVWILLWSKLYLNENISMKKIYGVILIIFGIFKLN